MGDNDMGVTLPYTFTAGTVARSSEVNANLQALANNMTFGTVTDNTTFEADGTMVATGAATCYRDIDAVIMPKATGTGNPTLATFTTNTNAFALNDVCMIDAREFAHEWLEGSAIEIHVHWVTNGANASTVKSVKWEVAYAWANMESSGGTITFTEATLTQATATTIAIGEAAKTHKYSSVGVITPTGGKIGGYLVMKLKRIAGGGTEPAADPFVLACGAHIQINTLGSRTTAGK